MPQVNVQLEQWQWCFWVCDSYPFVPLALHAAALSGHTSCVQVLLQVHSLLLVYVANCQVQCALNYKCERAWTVFNYSLYTTGLTVYASLSA